ncbi:protease modulator HflC [Vineibacter terrae]|uniref:protease modulator HflC n=1 Tax=Vineibacter terrae TaxID=2586908 RepID=UPI002E32952D|nr:protease modulator HflC [Vineibacter terrae]HEX2889028.1 protease modulator HflC [Vineibacter terrae]
MSSGRMIGAAVALVVLALLVQMSFFVIDPTKQALVTAFGAVKGKPRTEPGLYFKWPWEDVVRIDKRLLHIEAEEFELIAGDQKRLVVDAFARYLIVDPLKYYQATSNNEATFRSQLGNLINGNIRRELGTVPLQAVLSERREQLMKDITAFVQKPALDEYGVRIVDVRIKRADLPRENSEAVYNRMRTQREQEARQLRAEGDEESQRIKAGADRERIVLLSEARKKSETLRGEGDAQAIKIYAEAFGRDPQFFAFYRSMEAYRQALGSAGTTMVLSPDSDFFRYFGNIGGQLPQAAPK